ncbi:ethionine resistance protein [Mycoemilia scoparia]|uniref:Ethionine resistance protein n=1 Tax=Mycoemilia scoparia TaxID=417184 RepID=A0A9W8DPS1_9FUNG|nr:ethionine resistance protein [Mycoemilia scoparia]
MGSGRGRSGKKSTGSSIRSSLSVASSNGSKANGGATSDFFDQVTRTNSLTDMIQNNGPGNNNSSSNNNMMVTDRKASGSTAGSSTDFANAAAAAVVATESTSLLMGNKTPVNQSLHPESSSSLSLTKPSAHEDGFVPATTSLYGKAKHWLTTKAKSLFGKAGYSEPRRSASPLFLPAPAMTTSQNSGGQVYQGEETKLSLKERLVELKWQAGASVSLILAYILQYSFNFVTVMMVGHLGTKPLGAASLANMGNMLIACCPAVGFGFALDTFCSTAFTASADKRVVGIHLQRGLVAVFAHMVFVIVIFWNMEGILNFLRQDDEIAHLTGEYMKIMVLAALPWMMFENLRRFVQAQGYMHLPTISLGAALAVHIGMTWLLVWSPWFGFGYYGAAVANVISNWAMFLGLVLGVYLTDAKQAWGGWDKSCLNGMWEFYKLAIPSIIMFSCECFAFEFMNISSSYLGTHVLAAQSILLNTALYTFQVPSGVGVTVATRVGHFIGDDKPRKASLAAQSGLTFAVILGIVNALAYFFLRDVWGYLYTTDTMVLDILTDLMPIVGLFQLWDGINTTAGGILRGLGNQEFGAYVSLLAYYTIAIPFGVYLGHYGPHWGAAGMWYATSSGIFLAALIQTVYIVFFVDWNHEVVKCMQRLELSSNHQEVEYQNETSSLL